MRIIKFFLTFFFVSLLLLLIVLSTFASMSLQDSPLYVEKTRITDTEITQVRNFIEKNNPIYFKQGQQKTISITEKQISLFAKYLQNKLPGAPQIKIKLFRSAAYFIASIKLPANFISNTFGDYVNITAQIRQSQQTLDIKALEIGDITVPDAISKWLFQQAHQQLLTNSAEYRASIKSLTALTLDKQRLDIAFIWNKDIAQQVKNKMAGTIFSEDMLNRMNAYTQYLSNVIPSISASRPSLTTLLQPMFNYAVNRSRNNDPTLENRALFIVLGAYMLDKNIPEFMGDPNAVILPHKDFYLKNRDDLSKHFLVSAALTALADPAIAHAIGLEKEIKDSAGGSGFSFADLAADKAGVTLANTALSSIPYASIVQQRLSNYSIESDFMPDIQHLPEGLQNINFKRIYHDTDSDDYKRIISLIDLRIERCGIYNH